MSTRFSALSLVALTMVLAAGCDQGHEGLAPVTGRITYDGEPVPQGRVIFYPVDDRRMASGPIDAQGNFALTTFADNDGAYPGKHIVEIHAVRELEPGPQSLQEEAGSAPPRGVRLVPEKYANRKTSGLEADVKDENNTINFDLPK